MSGQMTVRLPDGTVARRSRDIPTPLYDATLHSDPARFMWLVGLGPYPGPLPKPPQEDTEDPAPGAANEGADPAIPPAGDARAAAAPGAEHDEPEPPQEELPLEPPPEPVCGLVSNEGETCGRAPGHEGGHGPAEESAA